MFELKRRDILVKLNKAVNLLGSDVDSSVIIEKLKVDLYPTIKRGALSHILKGKSEEEIRELRKAAYGVNVDGFYAGIYNAKQFLSLLGAKIGESGFFSTKYYVNFDDERSVLNDVHLVDYARLKLEKYFNL